MSGVKVVTVQDIHEHAVFGRGHALAGLLAHPLVKVLLGKSIFPVVPVRSLSSSSGSNNTFTDCVSLWRPTDRMEVWGFWTGIHKAQYLMPHSGMHMPSKETVVTIVVLLHVIALSYLVYALYTAQR